MGGGDKGRGGDTGSQACTSMHSCSRLPSAVHYDQTVYYAWLNSLLHNGKGRPVFGRRGREVTGGWLGGAGSGGCPAQ